MIIKPGQLEHQDELQHLKQLTNFVYVFIDKVQLETIQNVHESILRHLEAVLKAKGGKTPSEILLISHIFTLFCPTPIFASLSPMSHILF